MSQVPPLPASSAVEQARRSAERQARALSGGMLAVLGIAGAVAVVLGFALLDYGFGQDPHRLVKIAIGGALFAGILLTPQVGLFVIPILAPFILWLPKLPVPGLNTLNVLMGTVFFSYAVVRILQRQSVFRSGEVGSRLLLMLLMFGLWILRGLGFPSGFQYEPRPALIDLFRTFMIFGVFFVTLAMTRGERPRRRMAWALVLGVLFESLMTIQMGRNFRGRAAGSIDQPNDLGAFLAMFTPLAAALFFSVRNVWGRLVLAGTVAAGCVAVVLSVSRAGIIAMVASLALVSLRSSRALSIVLVGVLLTSPAWAPDYLKDRITGTQVATAESDELELEGSSADRVETWRTIGQLVANHPLDGIGFFGLSYALSTIAEGLATDIKDSAHNTYLRFLGEMGIFGLALFLWTLWTCAALALRGMRVARTPFDRQLALGYLAATLAMTISCMFGDRFVQVTIGANFWVLSALVTDLTLETEGARA